MAISTGRIIHGILPPKEAMEGVDFLSIPRLSIAETSVFDMGTVLRRTVCCKQ